MINPWKSLNFKLIEPSFSIKISDLSKIKLSTFTDRTEVKTNAVITNIAPIIFFVFYPP